MADNQNWSKSNAHFDIHLANLQLSRRLLSLHSYHLLHDDLHHGSHLDLTFSVCNMLILTIMYFSGYNTLTEVFPPYRDAYSWSLHLQTRASWSLPSISTVEMVDRWERQRSNFWSLLKSYRSKQSIMLPICNHACISYYLLWCMSTVQ